MTAEAEANSDTAKSGDGKATHFLFEHKIFGVKGAHFALAHDGTPLLHINLGDMKASLTLDTVRNEFGIKPETHDCDLLTKVALGLRFVKEIRPRDSIPREILDGTASWTVEPRHLQIAKGRLMIQLSTWLTGREEVIADAEQLEQLVDDPTTKEKVNNAFDALAEQLGLGKARRQEVVDKIEDMARELSYIEGLRDYFGRIKQMENHLATCAQIFRREKTVMQDLGRVRSLVKPPISQFSMMFDQVDAQTGEILGALKNIQGQIDYIRKMRDDLHSEFMKWDEALDLWEELDFEIKHELEKKIAGTYRFVARCYPQTSDWKLTITKPPNPSAVTPEKPAESEAQDGAAAQAEATGKADSGAEEGAGQEKAG